MWIASTGHSLEFKKEFKGLHKHFHDEKFPPQAPVTSCHHPDPICPAELGTPAENTVLIFNTVLSSRSTVATPG